jgi:hypothetical protein
MPALGTVVSFQWFANSSGNTWLTTSPLFLTVSNSSAPICTQTSYSTTTANSACTFSALWQDVSGLSGFIFSMDSGSGSGFINYTWTALSGNPSWAITLTSLPASGTVYYEWYANNTANVWSNTTAQSFVITQLPNSGGGGGTIYINPTPAPSTPYPTPTATPNGETQATANYYNLVFVIGSVLIVCLVTLVMFKSKKKRSEVHWERY